MNCNLKLLRVCKIFILIHFKPDGLTKGLFTYDVSQKWRGSDPPLSAKVRNWPNPPPPLVRKNQKPAYPPSPLSEISF